MSYCGHVRPVQIVLPFHQTSFTVTPKTSRFSLYVYSYLSECRPKRLPSVQLLCMLMSLMVSLKND